MVGSCKGTFVPTRYDNRLRPRDVGAEPVLVLGRTACGEAGQCEDSRVRETFVLVASTVDTTAPALDAAGGIWSGMSGSPVYLSDGRLLGAVSYGFSSTPSKIGGLTPAAAMVELLNQPAALASFRPAPRVAVPDALRRDLVASGRVTGTQAAAGLTPLLIPLAVSGLNATRIARMNADFERTGSQLRAYASSAASGAAAPGGAIFAGSNFAAALSYGDVTMAGIGTTTGVWDGKALAFGHPMQYTGSTTMSAHAGSVIAVFRDDLMGSYGKYTVDGLQVKRDGSWADVTDHVPVTPGQPLDLRVRLTTYRGSPRLVNVTLNVPAGYTAGGLSVLGGSGYGVPIPPTNFAELLVSLRNAPQNHTLGVRLVGNDGQPVAERVLRLEEITSGGQWYPVTTG